MSVKVPLWVRPLSALRPWPLTLPWAIKPHNELPEVALMFFWCTTSVRSLSSNGAALGLA